MSVLKMRESQVVGKIQRIESLDFTQQKAKMCLPVEEEGNGWSAEQADEAEEFYRKFLKLHVLYPEESIVPNGIIDEFWHRHILDTRKYQADCHHVFGEFLHHYPYFGLRGKEDAQDLKDSFERTCELFRQEFGIDPTTSPRMDCTTRACTNEGHGCIKCGSHK